MKKNKKLFAILTLVAFMMTLVPALAFATGEGLTGAASANGEDWVLTVAGDNADGYDVYKLDASGAITAGATPVATAKAAGQTVTIANASIADSDKYGMVAANTNVSSGIASGLVLGAYTVPGGTKAAADQAVLNNVAADAFVAFAKAPASTTLRDFIEARNAANAGSNQDSAVAALVVVAGLQTGVDFRSVNATDINTIGSLNAAQYAQGQTYLQNIGVILDTSAAVLSRADVTNATTLTLTFDKTLGGSIATGDVTVLVNGAAKTPGAAAISSNTVLLSGFAANTFAAGDTVTVAYSGTTLTNAAGTPVATFAATSVTNSLTRPGAGTIDSKAGTSVFGARYQNGGSPNVNGVVQLTALLRDIYGNDATGTMNLVVWAEEVGNPGVPTSAFTVDGITSGSGFTGATPNNKLSQIPNVYTVNSIGNSATSQINARFTRAGEYNVYATFAANNGAPYATNEGTGATIAAAVSNTTKLSQSNAKVVVNANATDPKTTYTFEVSGPMGTETLTNNNYESTAVLSVDANNVAEREITVILKDAGNRVVGKTINLSTNSANISLDKTSAVTDAYGRITYKVSGSREGDYKVYMSADGVEVVLKVSVGNTAAAFINLTKQPTAPVALYSTLSDSNKEVVFTMTDINGNVVAKDIATLAVAAGSGNTGSGAYHMAINPTDSSKYISFTAKPAGTVLKDADLSIGYNATKQNYYLITSKPFDKEGTYEIKMVLDNGNYVTVAFEVKQFQTPVSLTLSYDQESIELGGTSNEAEVKYIDANGTTQNARNKVTLAATGYAISNFNSTTGEIKLKNDEKYVGQTITVNAVDSRYNLVATASLLVADEAQSINFATATAVVNANNKIDFQIVDSQGNKVALGNGVTSTNVSFVVLAQPEGAKVSAVLSGGTSDLISSGKGTMALTSDKAGDVTVQVLVTVTVPDTGSTTGLKTKYYTGTQTFAVGKEAGTKTQVVMSIGSHELVKNGVVSSIDAAPMIQDNRTFVPFRALAEAFGATVDFEATTNTVTAKLDGTTVVLTIGSSVMTVGDEAKTLDVAPFISGDRTMVPVRAVAEALGFNVEATSNPDGTTADVVFTK